MVSNLAEFGRRDSRLLERVAHSQLPFQLLDASMQRLDHVPPHRRLLAQGLRRQPRRLGFGGSSKPSKIRPVSLALKTH